MIPRARLRMFADFFAAIKNEVAVDEMFLELSKTSAEEVGHFPRVPHWIGKVRRQPYLVHTASRLARIIWTFGGSMLYFLLEYLKILHIYRSVNTLNCANSDEAILGLSVRVYKIITPGQFPDLPQTWLTLPWVTPHELPEGANELPMLSILNRQDLLSALADAVIVTLRMQRHRCLSCWVLQSYTAFRWFLVRRAIDRLSGTLVTTEHYDRWAVLIDRSVRECRRTLGCSRNLIVVQHGLMGQLNQESGIRSARLNLPTRIRQVDELYVYNSNEASAFRSDVFAYSTNTQEIKIHFFKPLITLSVNSISSRKKILFVGHPVCEKFHIELYKKIRTWGDIEVYYKPHPKATMSASLAEVEWNLISEEHFFPIVDLLVSYPSTLVLEYEGKGIPASIHPIDVNLEDLPSFTVKTKKIIEDKVGSILI